MFMICNILQGFRYNITANHSRSLATTTRVPDLTDGRHTLRIRYDPNFDENAVLHPSFQTNGYTTWFLEVLLLCFRYTTLMYCRMPISHMVGTEIGERDSVSFIFILTTCILQ